ncbi:hypothetical protein GPALN_005068 [Globodera pallida]|nr:hypothetical protein GPALN_005068 [Globodera pallida]
MEKKMFAIPTLLFCAILVAQLIEQSNAFCCKVDGWPLGHPPHCNVFGCNCDCVQCVNGVDKACCLAEKTGMGCPNSRKRHALEQPKHEAKAVFQQADADGDGALNIEEAVHYLVSNWNMTDSELTSPSTRHWFSELDLNHNNKLEPNEIDAALTL